MRQCKQHSKITKLQVYYKYTYTNEMTIVNNITVPNLVLSPLPPSGRLPKISRFYYHERASHYKIVVSLFSRVLRDSTPRFVGPSVGPSIRRSVRPSVRLSHFTFWYYNVNP